tara:strand:+ start:891 stop:3482 length:2592 start_codon:yes stop_codon:yes gene_type:complete
MQSKKIHIAICSVLLISQSVLSFANDKPNILFIAIDDLRPELGCYGTDHIISPNIDNLAKEGIVFDRAYCQMAICMGSRKSLMSGYRPTFDNQMYDRGPLKDNVPDALTLNQHFQDNGYETVNIGKIYHDSDDDKGWTRNFRDIKGPWGSKGYTKAESQKIDAEAKLHGGKGPPFEVVNADDNGCQAGAFAQKAIEELSSIKDKPLFLALGFRKPHLPFVAPKKYWDFYDRTDIELTNYRKPPKGKPDENFTRFGELRNYYGMPETGEVPEDVAKTLTHGYYACVSYVDAQLGKVLEAVEDLDLSENTIVILWSDHGWKLGDYGWWCKHTSNEIDTRVPFIVKAPNAKGNGKRSAALVELVDLYPSLCELAGIPTPGHLEGFSLVPLLAQPHLKWKKAAFSIWSSPTPKYIGHSLRNNRYRYTEYRKVQTNDIISRELYDHGSGSSLVDENLATNLEHKQLIDQFSKQLHDGYRSALPDNAISYTGDHGSKTPFVLINPKQIAILVSEDTNQSVKSELKKMNALADGIMKEKECYTVTFNNGKNQVLRNNYFSIGPYWWPNPDTDNGLPYVRKDGQVNPERDRVSDRAEIQSFVKAIEALALTYHATQKERYAEYAVDLLERWFLDEGTRMSPNMLNAQAIPGLYSGRGTGIIDSHEFVYLVDYITLLKKSPHWKASHEEGIQDWFSEFLDWLLNHPYGQDESSSANNHGTSFDMQVIAIASYLQNDNWVFQRIRSHTIPRIDSQISISGEQPLETARTKSWNYTTENLYHFFLIGLMANNVGHDLFNYSNPAGGGYKKAIDYAIPYIKNPSSWPHEMIVPFDIKRLQATTQIAGSIYADAHYQDVIKEQCWGRISLRYFLRQ